MAAAISLSRAWPSGAARSVFKLPETSSAPPRGRWLMAAKMSYIVEASSGAK